MINQSKTGIYGTDLTKPLSVLIEDLRQQMVKTRGQIHDIEHAFPHWKERVDHVGGLLTCGIVALHSSREEIVAHETKVTDCERGRSLRFNSRGIGSDTVPGCFVCGETTNGSRCFHNIAAFVASEAEGREIVQWFGLPDQDCARLDSRPNRIQVKVGVCDKHLPALQWLHKRVTENHGRLRELDVKEARAMGNLPH